jgi:hypothetical protein
MQLHQRGVDLLVDVLDAVDHADQLTAVETRALLKEVAEVMSLILERDVFVLKAERRYTAREQLAHGEPAVSAVTQKISPPV